MHDFGVWKKRRLPNSTRQSSRLLPHMGIKCLHQKGNGRYRLTANDVFEYRGEVSEIINAFKYIYVRNLLTLQNATLQNARIISLWGKAMFGPIQTTWKKDLPIYSTE